MPQDSSAQVIGFRKRSQRGEPSQFHSSCRQGTCMEVYLDNLSSRIAGRGPPREEHDIIPVARPVASPSSGAACWPSHGGACSSDPSHCHRSWPPGLELARLLTSKKSIDPALIS